MKKLYSIISDKGNGLFHIDAKISNDNYKEITGFELTIKLLSPGNIGNGALSISTLMVAAGAYAAEDFEVSFDYGIPRYVGNARDIVTYSDYPGAPMFFPGAVEVVGNEGAGFGSDYMTVKYEGDAALFDNNSILTAYGIYGLFNVADVNWIFGEIKSAHTTEQRERGLPLKVKTVRYDDIPTVENGTKYNYVDIEVPEGEGPFPVVMWIHGGGWCAMDRKFCIVSQTMKHLLSKGFAVVNAEYTLCDPTDFESADGTFTGKTGYPQMIYDLKAAVRFLRANAEKYNLDPEFIAAMGESAGGHLSMLLGTTNGNPDYEDFSMGNEEFFSDIQAMVSYYGPADLTGMMGRFMLRGSFTDKLGRAASPYYQLSADAPPLFVTHGENDGAVDIEDSRKMEQKARKLGVDVTAYYYDDATHGNVGVYDSTEAMERVEKFIIYHYNKSRRI